MTYAADLVAEGKKYDYIVHDVFTGGAEPLELFTLEFLRDLKSLLKEDGVIAIVRVISPFFPNPFSVLS